MFPEPASELRRVVDNATAFTVVAPIWPMELTLHPRDELLARTVARALIGFRAGPVWKGGDLDLHQYLTCLRFRDLLEQHLDL